MFLGRLAVFLRGVLAVGHGGPEERAHKQVAGKGEVVGGEGGRGETMIPGLLRPGHSEPPPQNMVLLYPPTPSCSGIFTLRIEHPVESGSVSGVRGGSAKHGCPFSTYTQYPLRYILNLRS